MPKGGATLAAERSGFAISRDSTFSLAFGLLRPPLRAEMQSLYGALRRLDDLVDDNEPDALERLVAVESWCKEGVASSPESKTFDDLANRCGLRREPVAGFCRAMRHDFEDVAITTQREFETYCQLVAGSVGVMVAQIIGPTTPDIERGMTALGTAVQLAHILRDIDLDLSQNRVFLPLDAIEEYGPLDPGNREQILRTQISRADSLFDEAQAVYRQLSSGGRAVAACGSLYREILRQIERDGYGKQAGAPVVPRWRQRLLIARACVVLR